MNNEKESDIVRHIHRRSSMKVKHKLISISAVLSIGLIGLGLVFFVLNDSVQQKLGMASSLSNQAVSSSADTEQTLDGLSNSLNQVANELDVDSQTLEGNKLRLSLLERKSKGIYERLEDLRLVIEDITPILPEGSAAIFEIEDAVYELEDIQSEVKRELEANIQTITGENNASADSIILKTEQLNELNQKFKSAFNELIQVNNQNIDNNTAAIATIADINEQQNSSSIYIFAAILVIAILVIVANTYVFFLVTKPLDSISKNIGEVASGNLNTHFKASSDDEFGALSSAMNEMVDTLKTMIYRINNDAKSLLSTAQELEVISLNTQSAVENERAEIELIIEATSQMLRTVESVASASNDSKDSAIATEGASQEGGAIVKGNIDRVTALANGFRHGATIVGNVETHTLAINRIVDVIKEITEQTNLLSLNAAIEAARAGEQGRGFAVVANEVRELAMRTQKSTDEINDIISNLNVASKEAVDYMGSSEKDVVNTSEEAQKVNLVFDEITDLVSKIRQNIDMVAVASEQQSHVSREVQNRLSTIDNETEQVQLMSSNVVDQSSRLKDLSLRMSEQLKVFRI